MQIKWFYVQLGGGGKNQQHSWGRVKTSTGKTLQKQSELQAADLLLGKGSKNWTQIKDEVDWICNLQQ